MVHDQSTSGLGLGTSGLGSELPAGWGLPSYGVARELGITKHTHSRATCGDIAFDWRILVYKLCENAELEAPSFSTLAFSALAF